MKTIKICQTPDVELAKVTMLRFEPMFQTGMYQESGIYTVYIKQ